MEKNRLRALDAELSKLELDYDITLEQGMEDPIRLNLSHYKLREIIRKNSAWRKLLLENLT